MSENIAGTMKEVKGELLSEWVRKLMRSERGGVEQVEFLKKTMNLGSEDFSDFISGQLSTEVSSTIYQGTREPPVLNGIEFTEGHMDQMPEQDAISLYDLLKELSDEEASSPSVWFYITLREIRQGRIKNPSWLAVPVGKADGGQLSIQQVIKGRDEEKIDGCVRLVLRRLTGHPEIRGRRFSELYGTCSLAKAWWLGYLSKECYQRADLSLEHTAQALKKNWRTLGEYASLQLTAIAERSVLSGLIKWSHSNKNPKSEYLKRACKILGEESSWRAIGILSISEIESLLPKVPQTSETGNPE